MHCRVGKAAADRGSGLLQAPEQERRREQRFDARSTATDRMRGIPQYDAMRDKHLPSSVKDKLLRSTYQAAVRADALWINACIRVLT